MIIKHKHLALALLLAFSAVAHPSTLPFGVQNDVASTTVTGDWGFTECFSATYATRGLTTAGMLSSCRGGFLMVGARRVGSDVFEVLAAAPYADVVFESGTGNVTHSANGVEWYFNTQVSWGFAGLGDVVQRSSCDINGLSERDRLCWHTQEQLNYSPGWRAGSFIQLDNSSEWEKVLLVGNATAVPEPGALSLLALCLTGLGFARRRKV